MCIYFKPPSEAISPILAGLPLILSLQGREYVIFVLYMGIRVEDSLAPEGVSPDDWETQNEITYFQLSNFNLFLFHTQSVRMEYIYIKFKSWSTSRN